MKGTMKTRTNPSRTMRSSRRTISRTSSPPRPTSTRPSSRVNPPEPVDPADPAVADVESIQDLLVKQEARAEEEEADEDDDAVVALTQDERLEPLETRVVPIQATEFVCKKCFLVKHRSQLADKKRMLCRDCA